MLNTYKRKCISKIYINSMYRNIIHTTGAKPALVPNCMVPYLYIWYQTVPTQSGLSPCA